MLLALILPGVNAFKELLVTNSLFVRLGFKRDCLLRGANFRRFRFAFFSQGPATPLSKQSF